MQKVLETAILFSLCLLLTSCGGNGDSDGDQVPPTVDIISPSSSIIVDAETIEIIGTASDLQSNIARVQVNGVNVNSDDNFSNWRVTVPLSRGVNTFTVDTEDFEGNVGSQAAALTVTSEAINTEAGAIVVDSVGARAIMIDQQTRALMQVNLNTGMRENFFADVGISSDTVFLRPDAMAIDTAGDQLLVVDGLERALIGVDLATGARSVIANNDMPLVNNLISTYNPGLAVDGARNRALLLSKGLPLFPFFGSVISFSEFLTARNGAKTSLVAINLNSGNATAILDNDAFELIELFDPAGIVIDPTTNRAFILERRLNNETHTAIVAVNLSSNQVSIFSDNNIPNTDNGFGDAHPANLALDSINNRLIVEMPDKILGISLVDGSREIVSNLSSSLSPIPDLLSSNQVINRFTFDSANNRVLATKLQSSEIEAIDLISGQRNVFSSTAHVPSAAETFSSPQSIAVDQNSHRALVVDALTQSIVTVDLNTGARTPLIAFASPRFLMSNQGIALNEAADLAYVFIKDTNAPNGDDFLVEINLQSGAIVREFALEDPAPAPPPQGVGVGYIFGGNSIFTDANVASYVIAISTDSPVFDSSANRVLFVHGSEIAQIDLETGMQSHFFEKVLNYAGLSVALQGSRLAISQSTNELIIFHSDTGFVITVDLETQEQLREFRYPMTTFPGDSSVMVNQNWSRFFAIDQENQHAFLMSTRGLEKLNLETETTEVFSSYGIPNTDTQFVSPSGAVIDTARNRLLMTDAAVKAVYAIDLDTGERTIISK